MATRVGVDIGGTFTDLIFFDDESRRLVVAKVPTTPDRPEVGVVTAVGSAVPSDIVARTAYFLHGTTVGLNALLERSGALVGLLTTEGFRDALEIRRGDRDEMYNLFWQPPPPLVPRRLRLPVRERVMFSGSVRTPLREQDVRRAAEVFRREGVSSVAVAFLHAYARPDHELQAEALLRECGFEGDISLSHRISGEYREYERVCTTVIDAYVRGRMTGYLTRLEAELAELGFSGNPLVTRSGSGSMTFGEARERPFETIMSGPVAGAEGAGALARQLDLDSVITADVGGTSFDTCLVLEGRPQVTYEGRIVGLPVQSAWVDVRSIGAGGGSIAHIDVGGLLRVGPQSAGADPGPACYSLGGVEPTVTDAALHLCMFGSGTFASGTELDRDRAEAALREVAGALGLGAGDAAKGIMNIASANMANAIREITVERGIDPREMHLFAFGGAGPMMATLLARELEIGSVVIPPHPGNFSALGLLSSDLTQAAARTRIMPLDRGGLTEANRILGELFTDLEARQAGRVASQADRLREVKFDLRYVGQEYTLTIAVTSEGGRVEITPQAILETFTREYERTFSYVMDDAVEIVSVRATLRTPLPNLALTQTSTSSGGDRERSLPAYSFSKNRTLTFRVIRRATLATGKSIEGPAILEEETATTYLDAGFRAQVDPSGALFISPSEAPL